MSLKVAARYGDTASVFVSEASRDTVYLDIDLNADQDHWIFLNLPPKAARKLGKGLVKAARKAEGGT